MSNIPIPPKTIIDKTLDIEVANPEFKAFKAGGKWALDSLYDELPIGFGLGKNALEKIRATSIFVMAKLENLAGYKGDGHANNIIQH